ncbi:MAG: superoxide dismutase, Cu-Zn family [Acidobacteriota bacterium]|jgi:Cu-Zn family superoxide dismutase|nr:superoxide dismutase, Cu-Zn family [Acidobacteriota bacterium]
MNRYKLGVMTASLALSMVLAMGCGHKDDNDGETPPSAVETPASAPMETPAADAAAMTVTLAGAPTDTDFTGRVEVTPEGSGVRIVADVAGVDKDGKHGIHVHENGMCDHEGEGGKPFTSAGGHFNPAGTEHACPPTDPRHAGDLGNIEVSGGIGHMELSVPNLTADQLNGKAIILHAGEDDCKTQPTGNSGDRLACGVVGGGSGTM